jgi:hypothetical protein
VILSGAILKSHVSETVVMDGETIPLKANDASVWVRRDGA